MERLLAALAPINRAQLRAWLATLPPPLQPEERWLPEADVYCWHWHGKRGELRMETWGIGWEARDPFTAAEAAELEERLLATLNPQTGGSST